MSPITTTNLSIISYCLLCISCASNLYSTRPIDNSITGYIQPRKVYIVNPEHQQFEILKQSNLYRISFDSTISSRLFLEEITPEFRCGTPLSFTILTFGITPGSVSVNETVRYTIKTEFRSDQFEHRLQLTRRLSIWEWFFKPFLEDDIDVKAKALKHSKAI